MGAVTICALAYLIGSVPFGYLLVTAATGQDLRGYGSGSTGAINASRVAGPWVGLVTLAADVAKAVAAVLAAATTRRPVVIAAAALSVVVGHVYSAWFLVRGGRRSESKGVACALGVMIGLARTSVLPWHLALLPLGVWLFALLVPRAVTGRWYWVSPATMLAALVLPLAVWLAHPLPLYLALSVMMAGLILIRHKGNLQRLRAGTEPRWGERVALAGRTKEEMP
jgi:acyl phosphate:glycerol-3-phosphate acyltransferase